ncbi:MAG: hypothetical protein ACJ8E3_01090 [Sphingomicrobium sp.]
MTSTLKKLLVIGAMCWVAPLGAEPKTDAELGWSDAGSDCPYARAEAARIDQLMVKAEAPLLDHRGPAAALLP